MKKTRIQLFVLALCIGLMPVLAFAGKVDTSAQYVVFAWNDLGMHCLNPTYDKAVILPPYNTLVAQVVKRGNPPQVATTGVTVEYRIINNTYSYGKRDYTQFWVFMRQLFGAQLPPDKGLNLEDPTVNNGLSGKMLLKGKNFKASGIPVTPVDDKGVWNPFQIAEITVRDLNGKIVAQTRATIPTSDEINCAKCHGVNAFDDILAKHDRMHGTTLAANAPVLCSGCHGDPVLGTVTSNGAKGYLSLAIHRSHSTRGATCYDCHPGEKTKCSRSLAHTAPNGNCTACHGSMATVSNTITNVKRVPWLMEPTCVNCHKGVAQVDTGKVLYRNAVGHGGMGCPACHGSPHAMVPSREASDNYQAQQYMGAVKTIGSCGACHNNSKGEGASDFIGEHGRTGGNPSACAVCHTGIGSSNTALWPHSFQWKARPSTASVGN